MPRYQCFFFFLSSFALLKNTNSYREKKNIYNVKVKNLYTHLITTHNLNDDILYHKYINIRLINIYLSFIIKFS